ALTKESEIGTMESLLATPLKPLEGMIGKLAPYIIVGYIQVALILLASFILFRVPMHGSLLLLAIATLPFIAANLAMGIAFSSLAQNQLQAVQMTFFFFLPSMLLSGFMFPFWGMPVWAQWIGYCLPLTHFLRIVRGIMLKGNTAIQIWPHVWPIFIFTAVVILIGAKVYRRTLD
ncbi:MAG: ABC transporter permease, partial [Gammaproteobacteria bacterium]|nr:ABC transporter permease [Gammaproteobacteria bacterium]